MSIEEKDKEFSIEDAFDDIPGIHDIDFDMNNPQEQKKEDTSATDTNPSESDNDNKDGLDKDTEHLPVETPGAGGAADDVDWKTQAEMWEQKFKSFEGRIQQQLEERRREEAKREREFLEAQNRVLADTVKKPEEKEEELPKHLKEFFDDYPDVAQAVNDLLTRRIGEVTKTIEGEFERKIAPLMEEVTHTKRDSHRQKVLVKHPDAADVLGSNEFKAWQESLPYTAQIGSRMVLQAGSAEEVNALLDQYKDSTKKIEEDKPTSKSIIDEVKAGLSVPAGRSKEPKTDKDKSKDDFDAAWEEAVKALGI